MRIPDVLAVKYLTVRTRRKSKERKEESEIIELQTKLNKINC